MESTINKEPSKGKEQQNVLLGAISYVNEADYEKFLANIDMNQAVFILLASANYCQSRGVFNLDESELIAKAIKVIKRASNVPDDSPKEESIDKSSK